MGQTIEKATPRKGTSRVDITDELIASLKEGVDIMAGRQEPSRFYPARAAVDVRAIRQHLGLSQPDFAKRFGFTNPAAAAG